HAQETVLARAFQGPTFARIVFDWPAPVPYQARGGGDLLVIEFARPLTADLSVITEVLGDIVLDARIEEDGRSVTLLMSDAFQVKTTANGRSIIFDIAVPRSSSAPRPSQVTAPPARSPPPQRTPRQPQTVSPQPSAAPANRPTIRVRAGEHDTYTRVVFDWPGEVAYEVAKTGDSVVVRFNRPANFGISRTLSTGGLSRIASASGGPADGGATVTLKVADASRVRHFRNGQSVVVDILSDGPPSGAAQSAARAADPPKPPPRAAQTPPPAVPVSPVEIARAPDPAHSESEAEDEHGSGDAGSVHVAFVEEEGDLSATFAWGAPVAAAFFERAGFIWAVFDGNGSIDLEPLPRNLSDTVFLAAPTDVVGATGFRIRVRQDLFLAGVSRVGGTWRADFRRAPVAPQHPIPVRREAGAAGQARVTLPLPEAGRNIVVDDPEVGDVVSVVPSLRAGSGVGAERAFAQFRILATAQGIAVEPWSDEVTLTASRAMVEITAPAGLFLSEAGLQEPVVVAEAGDASDEDPEHAGADAAVHAEDDHAGEDDHAAEDGAHDQEGESEVLASVDSLLNYAAWRRGGDGEYLDQLRELNVELSDAPETQRAEAQWDMARFYFAHGMAPEAIGVLRVLAEENPSVQQDLTYKAVRGASRLLMGRTEEAAEDLLDPAFSADPGVSLWRGALFADRGDWDSAQQEFAIGSFAIPAVPAVQQARFKLLAARAALKADDLDTVEAELAGFDHHPGATPAQISEAKLVFGEARIVAGDAQGGLAMLDEVVAEKFRPTWAEAEVVRTNYRLSEGELDRAAAINQLERLAHVWRGGDLELQILVRLKTMHLESGNFRPALETLRAIANNFEGTPEAKAAGDEMEAVYRRLYLDGESEKLGPVAALGLYFDFRELTPVGSDGDQMVRNLADRLVSVDLLGRAAELIDFQVNFRLRGAEKARVAAKLAAIYLLDRQPEKALEALDKSRFRAIPGTLLRERRYLQTSAFVELQRFDDAQRLLAQDKSAEANVLRADIYWRTSDWVRAAGGFEAVLGNRHQDAAELSLEDRNRVMQMTVAYALANDREAIDGVRTRYGRLMAATEDASAFDVLTSNPDRASIGFRQVSSRIAQISTLDTFMDRYRSGLREEGVGAVN
ncbi:MAG: hypothetical protein HQ495_13595, partial [Alphaproteobacteria bacterium]|nr:hypothetical protein [Alphaproteobacteria bacterium]